jgi:flagellar motor protein MotB
MTRYKRTDLILTPNEVLRAKGYGDQYPIGDNSAEAGRARNRRISPLVTQK